MKRYSGDPYWTTARFNGKDQKGNPVRKGDRIFYYPRTRTVCTGQDAEQASADFHAAAQDEAFYNGEAF